MGQEKGAFHRILESTSLWLRAEFLFILMVSVSGFILFLGF